ncbi:hypothetical protein BJF78_00840 [Pseudonocardia sp. CNS-139]|nr:hypothetical protein BJF78_00840 [Pseudonocardia sp. CNS-139]
MITAPPSSEPNCRPSTVTMGSPELRSTCRRRIPPSDRPFIRAVRTKSSPRTSRTEARTIRVTYPVIDSASVVAGNARCCSHGPTRSGRFCSTASSSTKLVVGT